MRIYRAFSTTWLAVLLIAASLHAAVPGTMNYQGRLTTASGTPVSDGSYSVTFTIYDAASGGNSKWTETQSVTTTGGLFAVLLGTVNPIVDSVFSGATRYLGIKVATDPEISPRTRFATAPYAYISHNGGGWLWDQANNRITQEHIGDKVGIGRSDPAYPLEVHSTSSSDNYVARVIQTNPSSYYALAVVLDTELCSTSRTALFATSRDSNSSAAGFCASSRNWAVTISNFGTGEGLDVRTQAQSEPAIYAAGGLGLLSQTFYHQRAGRFDLSLSTGGSSVLEAEYTGSELFDHRGIWAKSVPGDYYGVGGEFQGGWRGLYSHVNPTGSSSYTGVYAEANGGSGANYGILGTATGSGANYGVYGTAYGGSTNWAGYFSGPVYVSGALTKAGGGFLIDHPLDPNNKLLQHSFVESPDMKNIYDGIITTDGSGYATVTLPDWFDALNSDYRYQLTVIGVFAQAIIAEKITDNHFTIRTDQPSVEVSWQVTGIRKDAWAKTHPMPVELTKSPGERGKYLNPDAYGLASDKAMYADPDQSREAQAKYKTYEESKAACAKLTVDHTRPEPACTQTVGSTRKD